MKGIIFSGEKCFLLRTQKSVLEYWDLPGGRVNEGESLPQALEREVREEVPSIGKFTIEKLADAYALPDPLPDGDHLLFLLYKINAEHFEPSFSDEHVEARWVSKSELIALNNSSKVPFRHYEAVLKSF